MDESRVKEIVETELPRLQAQFGLSRWTIRCEYGPCDEANRGRAAECWTELPYDLARINFDPHLIDDEAELLKIIRHELFHVMHGSLDMIYNVGIIGLDEGRRSAFDRAWTFAVEQLVISMEAFHANLTKDQN